MHKINFSDIVITNQRLIPIADLRNCKVPANDSTLNAYDQRRIALSATRMLLLANMKLFTLR
jgi:hypothetical protein